MHIVLEDQTDAGSWINTPILRRLLLLQPYAHGRCTRYLWAAVEGIRLIGFEILDVRSFRPLHGEHYSGMILLRSLNIRHTDAPADMLGPSLLPYDLLHHLWASFKIPSTSSRVIGPGLWRCLVLCYKLV